MRYINYGENVMSPFTVYEVAKHPLSKSEK